MANEKGVWIPILDILLAISLVFSLVTGLPVRTINDKHIKPCRNSKTSNTPPSRKNQAINAGQNAANLGWKWKWLMTNDNLTHW